MKGAHCWSEVTPVLRAKRGAYEPEDVREVNFDRVGGTRLSEVLGGVVQRDQDGTEGLRFARLNGMR